jgi:hypothetical protein
MTSIHITGDDQPTAEEAEARTRNYTPSVQEQAEETPEVEDKTPISDEEHKALDESQQPTFQAPFQDGEIRERVERFQVPGEWVPPYVKARRQREMMLPNRKAAHDLEARLVEIAKYDGAPHSVVEAVKVAREALEAVRVAYDEGAHPDNRRFARDQAAKDDVIVKVAEATKAVAALEAVARDEAVQEQWFDGLTSGIEEKRAKALDALREAEKAYASFRGSVASAQSLAVQQGRWDSAWHTSAVNEVDLNRVLGGLKETIALVDPKSEESDDYTTGRFLTEEYEGLPPHTLARLRRALEGGQRTAGGAGHQAALDVHELEPVPAAQGRHRWRHRLTA